MLNILLKNKGIYFSWKNREIQFHLSTNIPSSSFDLSKLKIQQKSTTEIIS